MNRRLLLLAFFILSGTSMAQGQDNNTASVYISDLADYFQTPGASVAIVEDGKIKLIQGFGTKQVGKDDFVDENTLFAIGSITKSFTALSLAMLVSDGKLHWDDRVIDYLPYFELYNPYVTQHFTVRDLLTHRSGLKPVSGGTLWYHTDLNREEIIKRLKYLEPVSPFRTTAAYQNTLFLVAAEVLESISGNSWESFVKERIFSPLEMENTVILQSERQASNNIALPHIRDNDFNWITIEQEKLDNIGPAGSMYSTPGDMANYMLFYLNEGSVNGEQLLKKEVFEELLTPQVHYATFPEPIHNEFTSYGLGLWITPKNKYVVVNHSGGIDGMRANMIMERKTKTGVICMANTSERALTYAVTHAMLGQVLQDKDYADYVDQLEAGFVDAETEFKKELTARNPARIANTSLSLENNAYVGTYTDKMYGDIYIKQNNNNLGIAFSHTPLFTGKLSHWHYDTFKIDWNDHRVPDGFITFSFNASGKITGFSIDQPNLLDVDFNELHITRKE